jgi:FkbM family methyltransferase
VINIRPKTVVEVGAGDFSPRTQMYWGINDIKVLLFEPNPIFYNKLLQMTSRIDNVKVFNVAITDKIGFFDYYLCGYFSFLDEIDSPIMARSNFSADCVFKERKIKVLSHPFDLYDDGSIDMLFLDSEGCDFFVLKNMSSLPMVVNLRVLDQRWMKNVNVYKCVDYLIGRGYKLVQQTDSYYEYHHVDRINQEIKKINNV